MTNYKDYYYKYKALKYYLKNNIENQKQIKGGTSAPKLKNLTTLRGIKKINNDNIYLSKDSRNIIKGSDIRIKSDEIGDSLVLNNYNLDEIKLVDEIKTPFREYFYNQIILTDTNNKIAVNFYEEEKILQYICENQLPEEFQKVCRSENTIDELDEVMKKLFENFDDYDKELNRINELFDFIKKNPNQIMIIKYYIQIDDLKLEDLYTLYNNNKGLFDVLYESMREQKKKN
jgi:hypothetical protein